MGARSAGLLVYRIADEGVEVLVAHPGGPYWAGKDDGAWSIPKGEFGADEDPLTAAYREFQEETGLEPPRSTAFPLGELRQPGGKRVTVWALQGDLDVADASSNTFEMEWPRKSGRMREFPEVDRIAWMSIATARTRLLQGQVPFLDLLMHTLARSGDGSPPAH